LTEFLKILKYHISQKSVQREVSCSTWTNRHDTATVAFHNA